MAAIMAIAIGGPVRLLAAGLHHKPGVGGVVPSATAQDDEQARRLWDVSEALVAGY